MRVVHIGFWCVNVGPASWSHISPRVAASSARQSAPRTPLIISGPFPPNYALEHAKFAGRIILTVERTLIGLSKYHRCVT